MHEYEDSHWGSSENTEDALHFPWTGCAVFFIQDHQQECEARGSLSSACYLYAARNAKNCNHVSLAAAANAFSGANIVSPWLAVNRYP